MYGRKCNKYAIQAGDEFSTTVTTLLNGCGHTGGLIFTSVRRCHGRTELPGPARTVVSSQ